MTWVKVDDDMPWHRKFRRTGDLRALCLALDLTGMCHCAKYGTDGFIDDDDLPEVLDVLPRSRRSPVLGLLVEVKRWERGTKNGREGYWVRNFLEYNPPAAEQEEKKKRHAEATARWRARQRGDDSSDNHVTGRGDSHVRGRDSAPGDSAPSPRGLEKPKGQASLTPPSRDPSPDPVPSAASPSLVASGASSAAEPPEPPGQQASGNGARCRHGNDTTTCGVCSPAIGTPPSAAARAELDAVRARNRRSDDTKSTGTEPKSSTTSTGTVHETSAK